MPNKIYNSLVELGKSTQLTLINNDLNDPHRLTIIDVKVVTRILNIAQIYHLDIQDKCIFIGSLMKLLKFLPELLSLKVHSLSPCGRLQQLDPAESCREEAGNSLDPSGKQRK